MSFCKFFCDICFSFYDIIRLFYDIFYDIIYLFYDMKVVFYDILPIIEVPYSNMKFCCIGTKLWCVIIFQVFKTLILTNNLLHATASTFHEFQAMEEVCK